VRVNTLRASREALAARLREEERLDTRPTPLAPDGLSLPRGQVASWAAFKDGWCAVQDEASMLIARLLAPQPGETVADCCAAPGTKATHLAQLMAGQGRILAFDPQAARLELLGQAAARLGIDIIQRYVGSVVALAERRRDTCDRALVDAPCSSLGVLRRNPEVKWRRTEGDLTRLQQRQHEILAAAASLVRPGGALVYATCSLEPEENEEVALPFLRDHPDWRVDWPAGFPVAPDAAGFIRLLPHVHGTDGFTAIRLRRAPGR
jgi:16S rRNA (cytosine967-C5)-methyltransferase